MYKIKMCGSWKINFSITHFFVVIMCGMVYNKDS